jgi:hypothetical protein
MIIQDQVNGFSNNNYKGYETFEEAQQEYQSFLANHTMDTHAIALLCPPTGAGAPQVYYKKKNAEGEDNSEDIVDSSLDDDGVLSLKQI